MSASRWSAPGWAALVAVGGLALLAPSAADAVRWLPFLLGLVVFSLPHGAVDHHVPRRLGHGRTREFVAVYALAVLAGLALWALAPVATLVAFLVVAGLHWGAGDAWFARTVHGRRPFAGRGDAVLFVAARGMLPVALPALAHPGELARGADAILGAVGAGAAPVLAGAPRVAGLVTVAAVVAAAAVSALRAGPGGPRGRAIDAGELLLLAVFFVVTPAVLAVGTYLLVWHAPRHVARLIATDPAQAALPPARGLLAWTREAAPLTLVSLAGLGLLLATAWRGPVAPEAVGGAGLALIAALTFPHAAVVAWMDRAQRVYTPLSPGASVTSTVPRAARPGARAARRGGSAPAPASPARAR